MINSDKSNKIFQGEKIPDQRANDQGEGGLSPEEKEEAKEIKRLNKTMNRLEIAEYLKSGKNKRAKGCKVISMNFLRSDFNEKVYGDNTLIV